MEHSHICVAPCWVAAL